MSIIEYLLSIATILADILLVLLLVIYLLSKQKPFSKIEEYIKKNAILASFGIALLSMLGSLYFSLVRGYEPCDLCWYQRICMYPLVLLFGTALLNKKDVVSFALPLAAIGAMIASYHVFTIGASSIPSMCSGAVSCFDYHFFTFWYVNIPVMSLTAFILIIVLLWKANKE
jgi:disulfide bond formation protein DsbB